MTPLSYRFDVNKAKNFPIFCGAVFKSNGESYDILSIVNTMFHRKRYINLNFFFSFSAATCRDLLRQTKTAFKVIRRWIFT